ncbi:hypothetical protein ABK040_009112 [Willaertia magna]
MMSSLERAFVEGELFNGETEYYNEEEYDSEFDDDSNLFKSSIFVAKTGTMFTIGPSFEHISTVPAVPEDTYEASPSLVPRMLLHDSQRLTQMKTHHRIVFDCVDSSPYHKNNSSEESTSYETARFLSSESMVLSFEDSLDQSVQKLSNKQNELKPYYTLQNESDNTLVFESRFESGNLRRAIQIFDNEYDLILKFDVNTTSHTQWYYFSPDSLYNHGMKPLIYSVKDSETKGIGWVRGGTDICYYRNNIKRKNGYYYTLTFTFECTNDNDTFYFAYSYPYTYTNLQNYLSKLEQDPVRRNYLRRRILCTTLAGNSCDLLTITSFSGNPQILRKRKGIVLSARVHPGESNSSYIIKGIIDFLTGPSIEAKVLRDSFIFKIIPMLNPDGVINGNYRCSLSGCDLNRRWHSPSIHLHPTIYHAKRMILQFAREHEVVLFCDFHGHSRRKNMFMYGCTDGLIGEEKLTPKVFPRLLWKISPHFSFQCCHFGKQKGKDSTARVVLNSTGLLRNCFTLEASFCGPDFGKHSGKHFNSRHYEQMGYYFCEAILDYLDADNQLKVKLVVKELELIYPEKQDVNEPFIEDSASSDDSLHPAVVVQKKKKKRRKTSKVDTVNKSKMKRKLNVEIPTATSIEKKKEVSQKKVPKKPIEEKGHITKIKKDNFNLIQSENMPPTHEEARLKSFEKYKEKLLSSLKQKTPFTSSSERILDILEKAEQIKIMKKEKRPETAKKGFYKKITEIDLLLNIPQQLFENETVIHSARNNALVEVSLPQINKPYLNATNISILKKKKKVLSAPSTSQKHI